MRLDALVPLFCWSPLSLPSGVTVPKQGLAVLFRALPDEARRPLEVGAATGPLHHHECVVRKPVEIAQGTQRRHDVGDGHCVRRVQEDDVGRRPWLLRRGARRRGHHHIDPAESGGLGVLPDQCRRTPVVLDERDNARPAGLGLQTHRATAGVQVEEPQAADRPDLRVDGREQCLAHPVGRRPGAVTGRRLDTTPACAAPDDPGHAFSRKSANMPLTCNYASTVRVESAGAPRKASIAIRDRSSESGQRCEYTSRVVAAEAWPKRRRTVLTDSAVWISADAYSAPEASRARGVQASRAGGRLRHHAVMAAAEQAALMATTVTADLAEVIVTEARNAYAGLPQL